MEVLKTISPHTSPVAAHERPRKVRPSSKANRAGAFVFDIVLVFGLWSLLFGLWAFGLCAFGLCAFGLCAFVVGCCGLVAFLGPISNLRSQISNLRSHTKK